MNKKLLFAAMSLAALTACTDNDFESQKVAQQEATPVTFEVLNNNDAFTRASMNGNKVAWSATDGDLFTLYHGAAALGAVTGYQNATYTAGAAEGSPAVLTTPSMILEGAAIMVWPADTAFNIKAADNLTISVPQEQPADIENFIPYVSDQIEIGAYNGVKAPANTAGYQREYPIYMRPMASQLNLKTDYAGTDATIAQLYTGGSACPADGGIEPIGLTSVELVADEGNNELTQKIAVAFDDPSAAIKKQWKDAVANNAWGKMTKFGAPVTEVEKLTTKCIQDLDGCKFLILPPGIVINTTYGKVIVAASTFTGSQYTDEEIADAWYRFISADTKAKGDYDAAEHPADAAGSDGKFKTTANIAVGLKQTLNGFSSYTAKSGIVKDEPIGAAATRYVKVLLNYLDMNGLHIKTDKQLRDAALVWKHLGAANDVEVLLDGDEDGNFELSQKTIKLINEINADEAITKAFTVAPCNVAGEKCNTIVVTNEDGSMPDVQNMVFIKKNGTHKPVIALADETTAWKWNGDVKFTGASNIEKIINKGTMVNSESATLRILNSKGALVMDYPFVNEGTWNITAGTILNVNMNVTNIGVINIQKEGTSAAQYRVEERTFTNDAQTLPERFLAADDEAIVGIVNNYGVFATVNGGTINNYALIEHADVDAKTYITSNQLGGNFTDAFNASTNKMGRINLPISNKDEKNISINMAANQGFVSVTIDGQGSVENVGEFVNYLIVKSGVTSLSKVSDKVKYLEVNMTNKKELDWDANKTFTGLILLTDVNIVLGRTVTATTTYLGKDATMYVAGEFNKAGTKWNGYYGDTSANVATNYVTFH